MTELRIQKVKKVFASGSGVFDVSLTIAAGEFFVLLGPSGCGKSTLLRLIAGLEEPDSGEISVDSGGGTKPPVAMVFQSYALYPHMTAFENIAFPLKLRGETREEIARRVTETAALAGLRIDLQRRPAQLSGGERQRVALARALVRAPEVILMDEPLSNLDAQLRTSLRVELKDFQRRIAKTVVYVTHDQVEALTLGDRIAVMRSGLVEQIGTPAEIYDWPANQFVASFVGQPPMNLIEFDSANSNIKLLMGAPNGAGDRFVLGIRPEDLRADSQAAAVNFNATVRRSEFVGGHFLVYSKVGAADIVSIHDRALETGTNVSFGAEASKVHFFDAKTGARL